MLTTTESIQKLLESLPCSVYMFQVIDHRIIYEYANEHFLKLYRTTTQDLIDDPLSFATISCPASETELFITVSEAVDALRPFEWTNRVNIQGDSCWFQIIGTVIRTDTGVRYTIITSDITDQRHAERVLNETEWRFQGLLDSLGTVAVQGYRMDGTVIYWNQASEQFYGYSHTEAIGKNLLDLIIPEPARDIVRNELLTMSSTGEPIPSGELTLQRKDGTMIPVYSSHSLIERPGHGAEMFCIDTDLSQIKSTQNELLRAQSIGQVGTWKVDLRTDRVTGSPVFYQLLGIPEEQIWDLDVTCIANFIYPADVDRFHDYWGQVCMGKSIIFDTRVSYDSGATWLRSMNEFDEYIDEFPVTVLGTLQNITEQKQYALDLERIAYTDYLTGLPNKYRFEQYLDQMLSTNTTILCVHYVDIDGLNDINTRMTNTIGDTVIIQVAERIQSFVKDIGQMFSMGGGKFSVVIQRKHSLEYIETDASQIQDTVMEPMTIDTDTMFVTACVGTAYTINGQTHSASFLIRTAENALYQAKLKGRNKHTCFSIQKYYLDTKLQIKLETIREALANREFVLYYQPKINLLTNQIISMEALIRWHHPEEGMVSPGAFLPYIEGHPLIVEVGDWVMKTAIQQQQSWKAQGVHIPVSVNVSSVQFEHPQFVEKLRGHAVTVDLRDQLELEILESGPLLNLTETQSKFSDIKQLGVQISLDDFGTGHSSLQFLKTIKPDIIKIDKSFVMSMDHDLESRTIVQAILDLGNRFHAMVVAEGLETPEQRRLLVELGCKFAQGYLISEPVPGVLIMDWTQNWNQKNPLT